MAACGSWTDRKSTRLNSSHRCISYAVFCLKKRGYRAGPAAHRRGGHARAGWRHGAGRAGPAPVSAVGGVPVGGRAVLLYTVEFFFLLTGPPRTSTLFPYTALSR